MKLQSLPSSFLLGIAASSTMVLSGGLNSQAIAHSDRQVEGAQSVAQAEGCTKPDSTGACPPGVTCCPSPSPNKVN